MLDRGHELGKVPSRLASSMSEQLLEQLRHNWGIHRMTVKLVGTLKPANFSMVHGELHPACALKLPKPPSAVWGLDLLFAKLKC